MSGKVLCFLWTLCVLLSPHCIPAENDSDVEAAYEKTSLLGDDKAVEVDIQSPVCEERLCMTDLKCRDFEEITENMSVGGCCPGCVLVLDVNEPCSPNHGPRCRSGMECDETKRKCTVKKGSCRYYESLDIKWKPECLPDGTFAPKQCKGQKLTGRCFCYSPDGTKLFGSEWYADAENMTCSCSRLAWQLQNAVDADNRFDVTLHCNQLGNFEPLQCDNGLCWCANEKTGDPITAIVPEDLMKVLPCYNETVIGSQYLRQCESKLIAQAKIGIEMMAHGSTFRKSVKQNCDPDGSYANFQIRDDNIAYCSWKDGTQLNSYGVNINAMKDMNCNCARDTRIYTEEGIEISKICDPLGGYESAQFDSSGTWYCVDKEGFAVSEPVVVVPPNTINCTGYETP